MSIQWVGYSQFWKPAPSRRPVLYTMPLVEEAVLPVAFEEQVGKRLSREAAIKSVSRVALRRALEGTQLNPQWAPIPWPKGPAILKAPTSTFGLGVSLIGPGPSTDQLMRYAPQECAYGVMEQWLPCPQWEIDGYVLEGSVYFFHPLIQHWDRGRIIHYERTSAPDGLKAAAVSAIKAVGLDNCPFCLEFRRFEGQWKVIELNARLGEDPGLKELIWDGDALEEIARSAELIRKAA